MFYLQNPVQLADLKRKQVRFLARDDICLLKEVLAENPYSTKNWNSVAEKVNSVVDRENFVIDSRRARERSALLLEQFKSEGSQALKRSGCEEELTELKALLQEISDLVSEEKRKSQTLKSDEKAKEIRKRALETLTPKKDIDSENDDSEVTPVKRSTSGTVLSYLKEKVVAEKRMKEGEMEIRKEELKLEREKFELEKQERLHKLESDKQQSQLMLEVIKQLTKNK